MTKKFTYCCDGGTIMLGNETSRVSLPNGFGDGEFTVRVITERTYGRYRNQKMDWLGVVEGNNIHIYNYDCWASEDSLTDENNILYTLPEGRWAVYALDGNILLELWD
jgi:hypothetical protein